MKILLATDGTGYSAAALEMIEKFKLSGADEVKIVSVVDMSVPFTVDVYGSNLTASAEIEKAARENADKVLQTAGQSISEKIGDVQITTEVLYGSPESRIVETAEAMNADLIIVGSHGYNRWERLLLGSVSDSVVHHAPCSVLVVRHSDK